ncbi:glycosyltransferase family 39 protein [Taibaiella lutea]|uniref:Glycosyltransferase family 39 protein n=1 Tax=Taibaiella lutea TaxID=2608001 RepID=A0A5M6CCL7_9BACT|nr:glycosyltransferase family 39 protein [Taibaiella lutea]KAA5532200.1 glycosyltransferase family 39 protein [Taibaiella lutea]
MFQKKNFTFLFILILLHALWFTGGMCWRHFYNGDSWEYIYLAQNLQHGWFYSANPALPVVDFQLTNRTPLYSILLYVSYAIFGLQNLPVFILQNILSIACCWMIFDLFRKLFPETRYKWLYLLFIFFYPAQLYFATTLTPDHLLQFFLMLYFRQLVLSINNPNAKRIAWMSLWLILATLTKPIMYPYLLLHVIFAVWYSYKIRKVLVLFVGIIPFVIMISYGFWNKSRTGLYHISSVQTHNLLDFNVHAFLNRKYGPDYGDSVVHAINAQLQLKQGLKAQYEFADQQAKAIIKENFAGYSLYHLKESIRFFIEPGKADMDLFTGYIGYYFHAEAPNFYKEYARDGIKGAWNYMKGYPYLPFLLLTVLFNVLRVIGWMLFLFNHKYSLQLKVLTGIYILYFAVITGPVANTRYFLPVLLVMSSLSILGFSGFIEKWKGRKIKSNYAR